MRRLLVVLLATVLVGGVSSTAAHANTVGPRARAAGAVATMMGFYDKASGRWAPDDPWWQSGNGLQTVLDYMVTAHSTPPTYLWVLRNTVRLQRKPLPWWPSGNGEFRADSTDDTGWWALAMIRAYDLTKNRDYLAIAKTDAAYIGSYWDDTCGGGVWWDLPNKTYKNAISNELYISLLASLHNRIPGDTTYLAQAIRAWKWFDNSGMINGQHLVNDGLATQSGSCDSNHGTTWTYNQGVILGGLSELYRATRNPSYLTSARQIADAVIASPDLSPGGILTEPCEAAGTCNADQAAFKGIFARNLGALNRVLPGRPYERYLLRQANSAYANDRTDTDQYGLSWRGPFDVTSLARQESAASLLIAVL
jgi:predicted alpha-1,6-mannanase (GH76 family)